MKLFDSESLEVAYCDNHVLVVVKPSGVLTQPDDTGRINLESVAKNWLKRRFNKPGEVFLHCIHRIDRPVCGLVIFARTSKALSRLNESSRAHLIERFYTAEVEGCLTHKDGILEHYLVHGDHRALLRTKSDVDAKKAVLHYRVLSVTPQSSLISVELKTGRYHQIRAQFSAIKHPIIGDGKYGAKTTQEAIHLACTNLSFPHPVTKALITLSYRAPF